MPVTARGADLPEQDEVWELEAFYLGQAIAQYILILSPEQVIIGGGVAKQSTLIYLAISYSPPRFKSFKRICTTRGDFKTYS